MSDELKLGELITGDAHRDAIHIAVAPVVAGCQLQPGEHVGLRDGEALPEEDWVGIVDPFLKGHVSRGERFYLFLYPNTVTGMRHQWSHPAFPDESTSSAVARDASVEWLTKKAEEFGWSYERLINLAENHWVYGDWFCGDYEDYDFQSHYPAIQSHLLTVGIKASPIDDDTYFRCSC